MVQRGIVDNLIGQKFGMLTVIARGENKGGNAMWICKCDCGNSKEKPSTSYDLKSGKVKTCGCSRSESQRGIAKTHGMTRTRIWNIWSGMKRRCLVDKNYTHVSVCSEWLDFTTFYQWAMSNGYSDSLTIDRIDGNGNYEPSNCRWVTMKVQQNNRRNNIKAKYNGVEHTLSELHEITGLECATIAWRIQNGWNEEDLFIQPDLGNRWKRRKHA